jgi:hypothetical protein
MDIVLPDHRRRGLLNDEHLDIVAGGKPGDGSGGHTGGGKGDGSGQGDGLGWLRHLLDNVFGIKI